MARAFDQILAELGSAYDPSATLVQQQIDAIPGSTDALIKQAEAKKDQAFEQITNTARRRGMGFSGIPLQEQAIYASTEFAPAIANVKSQAEGRRVSLIEALNGLNRDRRSQAQSIYDNELGRDFQERQFQEQIRQFNEQQAAARAAAAASAAGGGGGSAGDYLAALMGNGNQQGQATMTKKADGTGFAFTDQYGNPISAASYSKLKSIPFRDLLTKMAKDGDKGAATGLMMIGNDYGVDQAKLKKYFGGSDKAVRSLLW